MGRLRVEVSAVKAKVKPWLLLLIGLMVGWMAGAGAATALKGLWAAEHPAGVERARPDTAEHVHPDRPDEVLAAAVSRLAKGDEPGLQSLFADGAVRQRFAEAAGGLLPPGSAARVARADDLNAGAENGHRVPVEVWAENGREVMGLSGEVAFVRKGDAFRIASLEVRPIPLRVRTWAQAAQMADSPGASPRPVPFLGRFRLQDGERRLAVDARTGEVEEE